MRRVNRENTFHANTVRNFTNREHLRNTAALDLNDRAAETLETFLVTLDNLVGHGNRVAAFERGNFRLHPHRILGDLD